MSDPRPVFRRTAYLLTRRTSHQMCMLRPDPETNNAFIYCMALAALRTRVDVILPVMMSNHHHTVNFDRPANINEFTTYFHSLLAQVMNARIERTENFWSSGKPSKVELLTHEALVKELVYSATNPVKDGLVETIAEWPGVHGLANLLSGTPLVAHRPPNFFKQHDTDLPETISLPLVIPPELGDREQILEAVQRGVAEAENEMAAKRLRQQVTVLGAAAVLAQPWTHIPPKSAAENERRRKAKIDKDKISPRYAGCRAAQNKAIERHRAFLAAYRATLKAWLEGNRVPFPEGTYKLRRTLGVPVVGEPDVRPVDEIELPHSRRPETSEDVTRPRERRRRGQRARAGPA